MLKILQGDAIEQLRTLADESVHCCVTSPPYWGLRDYGTAQWEGGLESCDHKRDMGANGPTSGKQRTNVGSLERQYDMECPCGAKRIDSQLGLEKTPEEYVAKMVEVFREVRRVLRKDGTCWMNLGDAYAHSGACGGGSPLSNPTDGRRGDQSPRGRKDDRIAQIKTGGTLPHGLKPKDLCGIPWRVAFALQSDGWWLRSDIIWAKPNPMPESVTDRPTKAHEYLFLLTKSANYFYDAEAIKEKGSGIEWNSAKSTFAKPGAKKQDAIFNQGLRTWGGDTFHPDIQQTGRNKRSVWTVSTAPYAEAHFATYPPDLIKPCILAGTSAKGCCAKCGSPWERIVEKSGGTIGKSWHNHEDDLGRGQRGGDNGNVAADAWSKGDYKVETIGWQPTCKCLSSGNRNAVTAGQELSQTNITVPPAQPCIVIDPFAGSGTTGAVALELGRKAILIELNPKYVELIKSRCNITPGLQLA